MSAQAWKYSNYDIFFFRMFSAFKKLANRNEGQNGQNGTQVSPGGVQSMASNLQKKFSKVRKYFPVLRIRIQDFKAIWIIIPKNHDPDPLQNCLDPHATLDNFLPKTETFLSSL